MRHLTFTFLLMVMAVGGIDAASPRPPNIVMVFIDDMGWGDLGCYGNPDIKTPNIDRLAAGGIMFEQFYVASPICSPSRVAVTTGQYPARHKINSYLKKGFWSILMQWRKEYKKWFMVTEDSSFHMMKYQFFDSNDDEIRLS